MLQEKSLSRKRRGRHPGLSQSTPGSVARPGRSIGLVYWVSVMQGAQVTARRLGQGNVRLNVSVRMKMAWGWVRHLEELTAQLLLLPRRGEAVRRGCLLLAVQELGA